MDPLYAAFSGYAADNESTAASNGSGSVSRSAMDTAASSDSGVEPGTFDSVASALATDEEMPSILPTIEDVYAARDRMGEFGTLRTPLVRLNADMVRVAGDGMCGGLMEVYLKLENLQPTGSFELRGACNALATEDPYRLRNGLVTASTGNFAQGLASAAHRKGLDLSVVVPDYAPAIKHAALERLGAHVHRLPFDDWWQVLFNRSCPGLEDRCFIRPSGGAEILAGNATLALEILEDLPDVDAIVVPYSSGGLCLSVGIVLQALRPQTRLVACEMGTSTPLNNAMVAGGPQFCQHSPSFVDGLGLNSVLPDVWPHAQRMISATAKVSLADTAHAIRLMVERNHIVAEGAGAAPLAAALSGQAGPGKVVCLVSGGNIDASILADVLQGIVPMTSRGTSDTRQAPPTSGSRRTETSL